MGKQPRWYRRRRLAQASARLRERQDIARQWRSANSGLMEALGSVPDEYSERKEQALRNLVDSLKAQIVKLDEYLKQSKLDYAALVYQDPINIEEVQKRLLSDQALLFIFAMPAVDSTPGETFVWAIAKNGMSFHRSAMGQKVLADRVQLLRCGLDKISWVHWNELPGETAAEKVLKDQAKAQADRCSALPADGDATRDLGPFDLSVAYELYSSLIAPVKDILKNKHILVVPSAALTNLPLGVLTTRAPENNIPENYDEYRDAAWLDKENAITTLPSVGSLANIRLASRAKHPYIGFGNPLVSGSDGKDLSAWRRQSCSERVQSKERRFVEVHGPWLNPIRRNVAGTFEPDLDTLRHLTPLPETADEVCEVGRELNAANVDIFLGERATEGAVKGLSRKNELSNYRIVHFATHGFLPGQAGQHSEAALLLSPPAKVTDDDDGLLTASEIADLKLDADWVVLSACNTGAGGTENGASLSGLAKGFFYAGARSLLVSSWPVYSDAAVSILGNTFRILAQSSALEPVTKAEALRQAINVTRNSPSVPYFSHPAAWGAFILVGNGTF
jgi:CHAT domain-containing protein